MYRSALILISLFSPVFWCPIQAPQLHLAIVSSGQFDPAFYLFVLPPSLQQNAFLLDVSINCFQKPVFTFLISVVAN